MIDAEIFKPAFAMAGLTFIVFVRMYWLRLAELHRGGIAAQAVATSQESARLLTDTRASDNFRNLFELPVLFYAALCVAAITGLVTPVSLGLAWTFVVLRVLHSLVHCTYNRVIHRFLLYVAGAFVLFALWGWLAWQVLR
ncbi:MAPEG family protein [Lysobacter sp. A6]|uniref:MAPEG family protein n=1 Tax=Noviluteimonas lactosilytica TaxID=2888523 RepID=A0ABS8JDX6_9GAMM|nr:MAPEG family protein [Lysobacter lactosilyticus]MCC8361764.1 MAPEG family protein [Lysobacter lactosilyticus]